MQASQQYQLSKYRYVNLVVFLLASAVNSLPIQTLASINSLMQDRYQYQPQIITLIVLFGPIMHPFMATPCNWMLDKFGVRIGCTFGGVLLCLGAWARTFLQVGNPFWPIVGAILAAMGNVFVLSSPTAFALKWFPSQQVPKIIAVTVLFNFLSSGTGASIAGLILHQSATKQSIQQFFIIQAIIITIPFILLAILYRQSPKHPPSKAASAAKNNTNKQAYIETIKKLLKNSSYIKTIIAMSFSYGIFISFVSILDESLATLGYQSPGKSTSTAIGSAMLVGTFSAFMFTWAVRKTQQYRVVISLCLCGAVLAFLLLEIVFYLKVEWIWVIGVMGGCAGFFVIPLTALFTTYSSQLTYSVGQGSATGYLFAGSQTVGFISGMIWILILDKTNKWKVYLMFGVHTGFLAAAFLISLNTKQYLNKTNYQLGNTDNQQQKHTQSLLSQNNQIAAQKN